MNEHVIMMNDCERVLKLILSLTIYIFEIFLNCLCCATEKKVKNRNS